MKKQMIQSSILITRASDEVDARPVKDVAHDAYGLLRSLSERAAHESTKDSEEAAKNLLWLLSRWLDDFEKICAESPERFKKWARTRESWPTVYHSHPELRKRTQATMRRIELAQEAYLNHSGNGKSFSFEVPAVQVALSVYGLASTFQTAPSMGNLLVWNGATPSDVTRARLAKWHKDVAPTLPRLTRDTYLEWEKKTYELLLLWYGDEFQDHPCLTVIACGVKETTKDGLPSRARQRSVIRRALRDAWKSISPIEVNGD